MSDSFTFEPIDFSTATYSAEDNKLRLYFSQRLDTETYKALRAAGFGWAPKQDLFVAPKWTPAREDICTMIAGDIEPEETTLAERAELKAERLDQIAEKKLAKGNAFAARAREISQRFEFGQPILIGHHSERKARKDREKADSAIEQAAKAFNSISYWQYRAAGVQHHANQKNSAGTRSRRIKTLLAELRSIQRDINADHLALANLNQLDPDDSETIRAAIGRSDWFYFQTYSEVQAGEISPADALAREKRRKLAGINSQHRARWINHLLGRLGFERDMLGDVPRFEGDLTPVILQTFARVQGAHKPKATPDEARGFTLSSAAPLPLHIADSDSLTHSADEWRDLMQSTGYEVPAPKKRAKSNKPKAPALINLSKADAEQLQRIWNLEASIQAARKGWKCEGKEIREVTQAVYSANSKGDYAPLKTIEIDVRGRRVRQVWLKMERVWTAPPVARIRWSSGENMTGPDRVLIISDKPTKALPFNLDELEAEAREILANTTRDVAA